MKRRSACEIAGASFIQISTTTKLFFSASNAPNSKQQYKEFIIYKILKCSRFILTKQNHKKLFAPKLHKRILNLDFSSGTLNKKLQSNFLNDENGSQAQHFHHGVEGSPSQAVHEYPLDIRVHCLPI